MDYIMLIIVCSVLGCMHLIRYRRVANNSTELMHKWQTLQLVKRYGNVKDKL